MRLKVSRLETFGLPMRNYSFISLKLNFQRLGTIGFLPMKPKFPVQNLAFQAENAFYAATMPLYAAVPVPTQ